MREIEITRNGKSWSFDVDSLEIEGYQDLDHLNDHISKQPSLYAWYASILEEKKYELDVAKDKLDKQLAQAELKVRRVGILGVSKITESSIQSAVSLDDGVVEAKEYFANKRLEYGRVKSIVDALAQRKDMLATLSANVRKDLKNDY